MRENATSGAHVRRRRSTCNHLARCTIPAQPHSGTLSCRTHQPRLYQLNVRPVAVVRLPGRPAGPRLQQRPQASTGLRRQLLASHIHRIHVHRVEPRARVIHGGKQPALRGRVWRARHLGRFPVLARRRGRQGRRRRRLGARRWQAWAHGPDRAGRRAGLVGAGVGGGDAVERQRCAVNRDVTRGGACRGSQGSRLCQWPPVLSTGRKAGGLRHRATQSQ